MPYVSENSKMHTSEDDELASPRISDFLYLPAKVFGGPLGPAKLRTPDADETNNDEFVNPQELRAMHLALKACGIAKVYCRYDGGNDEGFAWIDHAKLRSGERLEVAELAKRLIAGDLPLSTRTPWQKDWSDEEVVRGMLDWTLAVNWAAALLGGHGFGTGEYSMYGAFVADLLMETISDDPQAAPVICNIEIDGIARTPSPLESAGLKSADGVPRPASPPSTNYNVGDRVAHKTYGGGTVTAVDVNRLRIEFDSGQTRHIISDFVARERSI